MGMRTWAVSFKGKQLHSTASRSHTILRNATYLLLLMKEYVSWNLTSNAALFQDLKNLWVPTMQNWNQFKWNLTYRMESTVFYKALK